MVDVILECGKCVAETLDIDEEAGRQVMDLIDFEEESGFEVYECPRCKYKVFLTIKASKPKLAVER